MSLPDGVYKFALISGGMRSSDVGEWRGFNPTDERTLDSIAKALRPILYRRLHIFEAAHRIPAGPEDLDTVLAAALAEVFKG